MTPSRILPDLQCSLIAEDIRREANGKFMLIGLLEVLPVQQFPLTAFIPLKFFNRWVAGVGTFTESIRLVAPDNSVVFKSDMKFGMKDSHSPAINGTVMGQVTFSVPGLYYVEVLVDDVMKLRYPLPIAQVQQQPPPGQPPAS